MILQVCNKVTSLPGSLMTLNRSEAMDWQGDKSQLCGVVFLYRDLEDTTPIENHFIEVPTFKLFPDWMSLRMTTGNN